MNIVLDTSALIQSQDYIKTLFSEDNKIFVPSIVCDELDLQKESGDNKRAFNGRTGLRFIEDNIDKIQFYVSDIVDNLPNNFDINNNDNKIISTALKLDASIVTKDRGMKIKAMSLGISCLDSDVDYNEFDYNGYKKLELDLSNESDEFLLASMYNGEIDLSDLDLIENEYLIIVDINKNEEIDAFKLHNNKLERVLKRTMKSSYLPKVTGRDFTQHCVIDSLYNNDITMITGKAGSGKTHISLAYCMEQVEKGKYDKVLFFVNPAPAKNAQEIGFRPGTTIEKLMSSSAGVCLSSKFGGSYGLMRLIDDRKIEILPMVDIRGLDTGEDTPVIIYILEAQNLDIELMKLALQRCGKSAKIIIDGDDKTQVDKSSYAGDNNGMKRVSKVFKGINFYGEVELENIYRSKIAEIADKM